jgi:hypothetical protein
MDPAGGERPGPLNRPVTDRGPFWRQKRPSLVRALENWATGRGRDVRASCLTFVPNSLACRFRLGTLHCSIFITI